MRFVEFAGDVPDPVDTVISVSSLIADASEETGEAVTVDMDLFLKKLYNAGVNLDYTGLKNLYDTNPAIKNVIQNFNDDKITFTGGEPDEDEYEKPTGDVDPETKVDQMAKRATRRRDN